MRSFERSRLAGATFASPPRYFVKSRMNRSTNASAVTGATGTFDLKVRPRAFSTIGTAFATSASRAWRSASSESAGGAGGFAGGGGAGGSSARTAGAAARSETRRARAEARVAVIPRGYPAGRRGLLPAEVPDEGAERRVALGRRERRRVREGRAEPGEPGLPLGVVSGGGAPRGRDEHAGPAGADRLDRDAEVAGEALARLVGRELPARAAVLRH